MLILLLFVYSKHHYFVQLNHLYLTEFCLHSTLRTESPSIFLGKSGRGTLPLSRLI